jgi:hypothetical protein
MKYGGCAADADAVDSATCELQQEVKQPVG